jgi:hypothetical protein
MSKVYEKKLQNLRCLGILRNIRMIVLKLNKSPNQSDNQCVHTLSTTYHK